MCDSLLIRIVVTLQCTKRQVHCKYIEVTERSKYTSAVPSGMANFQATEYLCLVNYIFYSYQFLQIWRDFGYNLNLG